MTLKLAILCVAGLALAAAAAANPTPSQSGGATSANPTVVVETSMGTVKIELYPDKAPITVKNFLSYVEEKHYNGTIFHRVIGKENSDDGRDFMIQGGGFDESMKEKKAKAPIKNEAGNGLSNAKGTIAMARTSDPDSATAQFYINVGDNTFLDRKNARDGAGYCVFGRVTSGMDVVEKIKAVPTGFKNGMGNVPSTNVVIKSVTVEKK